MSAPARACRGQTLERGIVVHAAVVPQRSAVAVVRVLAQAGIGDRHERELARPDPREGILDDPVLGRRSRAGGVLHRRQTEQDDPADTELGKPGRLLCCEVGRESRLTGHRPNRLAQAGTGLDEQWGDEHRRLEVGLADQRSEGRRAPQAARSDCQSGGGNGLRWRPGSYEVERHVVSFGWRDVAVSFVAVAVRAFAVVAAMAAGSGLGDTARIRKPAARASSAVSGPMHTAGTPRTSIDSACPSDTRPRTVEPLVNTTAAIGPPAIAARRFLRDASGASRVR
jgi:hypothetical protein